MVMRRGGEARGGPARQTAIATLRAVIDSDDLGAPQEGSFDLGKAPVRRAGGEASFKAVQAAISAVRLARSGSDGEHAGDPAHREG